LDASLEQMNIIMAKLLKGKYAKQERLSDADFIRIKGNQGFP
jgi:hypothetical protein